MYTSDVPSCDECGDATSPHWRFLLHSILKPRVTARLTSLTQGPGLVYVGSQWSLLWLHLKRSLM